MENTNIYNQLKTASESFFDRDLKFSTGDKLNGIDTGRVRWLSEFSYNDKQGTVKIVFTPQVIKEISRIDGRLNPYISYVLGNVCSMSNTYAIRIYEWLLAYKLVGVRELSVAWMREQLEIGDKYKEFTIFRRDVIDVAMREIGKCSDITAKYKLIKTGRSVTSIVFMFSFKQPDSVTKDKTTKRAKPKLPPPRIGESQQDYDERVRREAYEAEIKRVRESQLKNIPNK
jgi:plasmid replication initiation protein